MFWGEHPPAEAKATLQTHISALRRLIGAASIVTEGYGYRLHLDGGEFDVWEFVAAADRAREAARVGDWENSHAACSSALGKWRGRPYADLADDQFARADTVRLEELHAEVWEMWAEGLLRLNRPSEALPELERLVMENPLRERLWQQLMTARYRLGRHAEALRAFQEYRQVLAELGLEPGKSIARLEEQILQHRVESNPPPHNLPTELSTFIGRERELEDLGKLLAEHRLVTLTGVGGSGKTRLAIEAARDLLDLFTHGCWLVDLAGLGQSDSIPIEIAATLGIKPQEEDPLDAVAAVLRREHRLLVLDNCEHLLEGAAGVARRLATTGDRVRILATSRERLHVPGESVYEVPPLSAPPEEAVATELRGFDAVRLFEDRAGLVDSEFDFDKEAVRVARICRRLEGIPLAIELLASKSKTLGLDLIDRHLQDRLLPLVTDKGPRASRHQTLEAALRWSFDLLDEGEQTFLMRIAVFRGGFEVDMAHRVAAAGVNSTDWVIRMVESLVEKSLVTRKPFATRYRLLEPIREFAEHQLQALGDPEATRQLHVDWCADFSTVVERQIYGAGRHELLGRLQLESDNLQAGLAYAEQQGDRRAVSLISSALAWNWVHIGNARPALDSITEALASADCDTLRQGELHARRASLGFLFLGAAAREEASVALHLLEGVADSAVKSGVLCRIATLHLMWVDQDPAGALPLARQAVAAAQAVEDTIALVRARTTLGLALAWNGEPDEGLRHLVEAANDAFVYGDNWAALDVYNDLFTVAYLHPTERRDVPRREAQRLLDRLSLDEWERNMPLQWLPYVYLQSGEWDLVEDANQRMLRRSLEGYDLIWYLMTHSTLRWMQGDLDEAERAMVELEEHGVNPRWYHDYYPLRVDIAADRGDLESARQHADEYLATEVHPSEEAKKLGVLNPLVRAEINAAVSSPETMSSDNLSRAGSAVLRGEEILQRFPPPTEGSLAMETEGTHLAFARAELSRATGSDPELWRIAMERADYLYFRLYAQLRHGEALIRRRERKVGTEQIEGARDEAVRVGALQLKRLADAIKTS
jgi:predicted ATPase/DNA-binding SARP family transcriptional activator